MTLSLDCHLELNGHSCESTLSGGADKTRSVIPAKS